MHRSEWREIRWTSLVCLALGIVACLPPFFASVIPPLSDVSSHVLVAKILTGYDDPSLRFSEFYDVAWRFRPAELAYVLLGGLQELFGAYGSARAYIVIWVLLLAGSVMFLARSLRSPDPMLAALLVLPLAFSWFVWMGFLPFIMTFPLFAFIVGTWLTDIQLRWKIPLVWVLLAALYDVHIVGFCAAFATILAIGCFQAMRGDEHAPGFRWVILAIAPVPFLLAHYLLFSDAPVVTLTFFGVAKTIYSLFSFTWSSLTTSARTLLALWMLTCLSGALVLLWRKQLPTHVAVAAGLLALIGLIVPSGLGGLWPAGPRMMPFVLVLLVAATPWSRRYTTPLRFGTLGVLAALSAVTTTRVTEIGRDQREYLRVADDIKPGSRILSVMGSVEHGSTMTWPYLPLISAPSILKGGSSPYTFATPFISSQATPLHYRLPLGPEARVMFYPSDSLSAFKDVDKRYDYVITWRLASDVRSALEAQFTRARYDGQAELWVPKSDASVAAKAGLNKATSAAH